MDVNRSYADLTLGLPADVLRYAVLGDTEAVSRRIAVLRGQNRLPAAAPNGLLALEQMLRRNAAHYTYTRAEAIAALRREIPDFSESDFDALLAQDRVDWRCVGGEPRYVSRFIDALRLYPDINARGLAPDGGEPDVRDAFIAAMHKNGGLDADITLRATIAPAVAADPDAELCAWLPLPAACEQQSDIQILDAAPGAQIAPETAPQRTIYWRCRAADAPPWVNYRYHIHAQLVDTQNLQPAAEQPDFYTGEEAPHLLFTPWLRSLCVQITAPCHDPAEKARAIYDYVTRNTNYRYQPAYACLDAIADNCAKSGWGDCGVMALLFIALCRIAGIPARWQSGLYVTPHRASPHDWAQFYIAPYGWLWADCSFGAGAHRMGNEQRRRHYFGNLDPLRMVANRAFYAQLTPPDEAWRNDPYDNQIGEATLNGEPLLDAALTATQQVLDFTTTPVV